MALHTDRPVEERLGALLLQQQKISPRDLEQALAAQTEMGDLLGRVLVRLGLLSELDVARALSGQLDVPLVQQADYPDEALEVPGLAPDYLVAQGVVPLQLAQDTLDVAMAVPQDGFLLKALRLATGLAIRPHLALEVNSSRRLSACTLRPSWARMRTTRAACWMLRATVNSSSI